MPGVPIIIAVMYNYMVLNTSKEKPPKDFMSYYKRNKDDELLFVSVNQPELIEYLEEYLEKSLN